MVWYKFFTNINHHFPSLKHWKKIVSFMLPPQSAKQISSFASRPSSPSWCPDHQWFLLSMPWYLINCTSSPWSWSPSSTGILTLPLVVLNGGKLSDIRCVNPQWNWCIQSRKHKFWEHIDLLWEFVFLLAPGCVDTLINWLYLLLSRPTLGGMEAIWSPLYKYYIARHGAV